MRSVGSNQDITARKRAEEALRVNEAQLRAILDYSAAVIFVKDLEGRYLRVNRWYEAKHGTPEAEVKGKTDYDLHAKEIADAFGFEAFSNLFITGVYSKNAEAKPIHGARVWNYSGHIMKYVRF